MTTYQRLLRSLTPLIRTLLTLLSDAAWYIMLCQRRSPALAAENLFLRKQLALYQEGDVKPRRVTHAIRIALAVLACWFDWRQALVSVQPATPIRWHRQGFFLFWRWKLRPGRPPLPLVPIPALPKTRTPMAAGGEPCHRTARGIADCGICSISMRSVKISMIGAGAANIAVSRLLIAAGVPADHLVMVATKGLLHQGREGLRTPEKLVKWHIGEVSHGEGRTGGIPEAMPGTDVCIALSCPEPGLIKPAWVTSMANEAMVLACAHPLPELWPWEAKEVGARIVAPGRSDFANQVNNALGFPASFRGVLDVEATKITDEMCIAAAEEKGLSAEYILPRLDDWEVFPREAAAVGLKAIAPGIARRPMTQEALLERASTLIKRARDATQTLMEHGIIPLAG